MKPSFSWSTTATSRSPASPTPPWTAQLTRNGVARAYRGDDGIWYCADSVEPKRAATPRYAVVRMGEVAS